jgi:putative glycosyltransferase (TIGR04348 family)
VLIVSPSLADANNGNWHTAARWARLLRRHSRIAVAREWRGEDCDLLIALHARKSGASVAAYARAHPTRPLVVVLTGTDLYRDIRTDATAQASLAHATRLIVLQDEGPNELAPALRAKCHVVYQSAPALTPAPPPGRVLRVLQVGHLRDEKDPATFLRAAARLADRPDVRFELVGEALDPALGRAAEARAAAQPSFRWTGGLPRADARQHIRAAHLLVSTSRMEGGAQVILEAARSGTAVLASRIPGNVGMLGARHGGWFALGDDAALAALVARAADDRAFLARLRTQTVARAPRFDPAAEEAALVRVLRACRL